ncbi:hypothetical protein PMAYCL1PPCAC_11756, partial [Pristionchus mayeri]
PLSRMGRWMGNGLGMTQSMFDPLLTSSRLHSRSSDLLRRPLLHPQPSFLSALQRVEEAQERAESELPGKCPAPASSVSQVCLRRLRLRHLRVQEEVSSRTSRPSLFSCQSTLSYG